MLLVQRPGSSSVYAMKVVDKQAILARRHFISRLQAGAGWRRAHEGGLPNGLVGLGGEDEAE